MTALAKLPEKWREEAADHDRHKDPLPASILRECADELEAALSPAELGGVPVAWTVVGPDGKSSIGGWMDMRVHEAAQAWAVVREGHRYAYAYEGSTPRAAEAVTDATELLQAYQSRFGATRPDDEDDAREWDRIEIALAALTTPCAENGNV